MENATPATGSHRALIDRLQAEIHRCLGDLVTDEPFAIVDFPDIRNCGDSAIWVGEMAYLRDRHGRRPAYVSRLNDLSPETLRKAVPEGPVFIHGGGNFGDIWLGHQKFRERVLEEFRDRRVIQFPQSIHFGRGERLETTKRAIAEHGNFVVLARDEHSREFAETHFDCEVRLCPDMAFCIGPLQPAGRPELPVLAMLREDAEKAGGADLSAYVDLPVEDWITESRTKVRIAKALGAASALTAPSELQLRKLDAAANQRLGRGIRQLSRAQAIVTDRLHVHICSLLLGKPHAVLDNSYGKIQRYMDTFSGGTSLSYRATSLDDGVAWARAQAAEAD